VPALAETEGLVAGLHLVRTPPAAARAGRHWVPLAASVLLHVGVFAALWGAASSGPALGGLRGSIGVGRVSEDLALADVPPQEEPPTTDVPPPLDAAPPLEAALPLEDEEPVLEVPPDASEDLASPGDSLPLLRAVPVGVRTSRAPPPDATPVTASAPASHVPAPVSVAAPAAPAPTTAAAPRPGSGGGVVRPTGDPANRAPAYPPDAAARGERGSVTLRLTISRDGTVTDVAVDRSSGYPSLDRAAVEAAWAWHFRPALRDGFPITSAVRQTVHFS